ncbi:hypothetical protein ACFOWE_17390 [Planomonospora corallina]|uniref:Uncharacterized protein n=1 Tax=Planomonospora corallina TaxID=1806052 RepID=A0ABV8I798_9ACTN
MNDRPDRDPERPASGPPADRLVHSVRPGRDGRSAPDGRDGRGDGLGDTGPMAPPRQRAGHAGPSDPVSHDDAPAGRPGDLADTGPAQTDADRPGSGSAAVPDPAHTGPGHSDPGHSDSAERTGAGRRAGGEADAAAPRAGEHLADGGRVTTPAPASGGTVPAAGARSPARLSLLDADPEDVRRRWQQVQVGFVDDPRGAVERADSLLGEMTEAIRAALESRTSDLRSRWRDGRDDDTERLRTALRDYRSVLEQLLELAAVPAGNGASPGASSGGAPAAEPRSGSPSLNAASVGAPSGNAASADTPSGNAASVGAPSGSTPAGRE